jgi:DNA-binding MarR family transcriptional regulator
LLPHLIAWYANDIDLEPTTIQTTIQLGRAAARLAKVIERPVTDTGLSLPQYRVLAYLSDGDAAASALADRLAVSPPSVTSLVDGLLARSLVTRRHHDTGDRRRVSLAITAEGRRVLADADQAASDQLKEVAGLLGDAELTNQALEALGLWQRALDAHRESRLAAKQALSPKRAEP